MDGEALKKLNARNIPSFDMESGLTTADYGWGTKNFRQLGLRKTELIITLPEAQILVTSDHLMSTTGGREDELEEPTRAVASAWNIGYMYIRHDVLHAMLHWQQMCSDRPDLWDQNLFKDVLKMGGLRFKDRVPAAVSSKRLFLGYNGTIAIGILPVSSFCSGHTYFIQRMPQRRRIEAYSVHTTFQYSGAVGKTHRLREAMLWEDEPGYYTPSQGLLSYTPTVDRSLIRPSGVMTVKAHFELVNQQLVQIRAAFLLARRLKRLLILPELVCGLDRFWAPHNGTIPGSDTKLPIDPCPADHVIDLEAISRQAAPPYRGTVEGLLRESSFLSNPRLPYTIATSRKELPPPTDLAPTTLTKEFLTPQMEAIKVLHFTSMGDLFATLPPLEKENEMRRMNTWTSIWCCSVPLAPRKPGHVWYDLFWDVVPRKNRHNKLVDTPWEPTFGP